AACGFDRLRAHSHHRESRRRQRAVHVGGSVPAQKVTGGKTLCAALIGERQSDERVSSVRRTAHSLAQVELGRAQRLDHVRSTTRRAPCAGHYGHSVWRKIRYPWILIGTGTRSACASPFLASSDYHDRSLQRCTLGN